MDERRDEGTERKPGMARGVLIGLAFGVLVLAVTLIGFGACESTVMPG